MYLTPIGSFDYHDHLHHGLYLGLYTKRLTFRSARSACRLVPLPHLDSPPINRITLLPIIGVNYNDPMRIHLHCLCRLPHCSVLNELGAITTAYHTTPLVDCVLAS